MNRVVGFGVVFVLFPTSLLRGQTFDAGIGGGAAILKSETLYTDPAGYGFGPAALSFQAIVKCRLQSQRTSILAGVTYVPLSGSVTQASREEDFRYPGLGVLSRVAFRAAMTSVMVGTEWFIRREGAGPYIGAHILVLNLSSIKSEKHFARGVVSECIDGWTGIDAGIHTGIEIPIATHWLVDLEGHYNLGWITELYDGSRGLNAFGGAVRVLYSIE